MKNHLDLEETKRQDELLKIGKKFISANFGHFFFFKHPAFSEEREWRLVEIKVAEAYENLHFRQMQGIVVPYVEIRFPPSVPEKDARLPIVEIVQGPLVDQLTKYWENNL